MAVFNKEDARAPTRLVVSYKGWWRLPMLQVPLALTPLRDGVHATKKDGKITLVQRFQSGRAPTFHVKGRDKQLVLELCAGARRRTRALVHVGDLVSGTASSVVKVPFEVRLGGKVEKAFLTVAQLSPVSTPPPPPVYPVGYKRGANHVPHVTFPLGDHVPSPARLQFLVQQTHGYGPMPDPMEWLLPHSNCTSCNEESASYPLSLPREPSGVTEEADGGDAHFVQLWEEVFGKSANQQGEEEQDRSENPQHPGQVTPEEVSKDYVWLWNQVFGKSTNHERHDL